MDKVQNSIIKKFRKPIWREFIKAIDEFNLINDGDKIAVCISGGKDSFLLAKCMEELRVHGKKKFDIVYLLMNPGYKDIYLNKIYEIREKLGIDLTIFKTDIFDQSKGNKNTCYLCARKRRGALYSEAKKHGCNKIALGHHFNDVVETILMSMIYNGEFKTMKPILDSTNYKGMKLIRPLYYVKELDIIEWTKYNNLEFIGCSCEVVEQRNSKRYEMKELVSHLNKYYRGADINILNSTKNVNLNTLISYKEDLDEN